MYLFSLYVMLVFTKTSTFKSNLYATSVNQWHCRHTQLSKWAAETNNYVNPTKYQREQMDKYRCSKKEKTEAALH